MQQQLNGAEHSIDYELAFTQGVALAKDIPGLGDVSVVRYAYNWFRMASERMQLKLDDCIRGFTSGYSAYEGGII
jgi:hypothetical protein